MPEPDLKVLIVPADVTAPIYLLTGPWELVSEVTGGDDDLLNQRATLLALLTHGEADDIVLTGDAVCTGPVEDGRATSVPSHMIDLVIELGWLTG